MQLLAGDRTKFGPTGDAGVATGKTASATELPENTEEQHQKLRLHVQY